MLGIVLADSIGAGASGTSIAKRRLATTWIGLALLGLIPVVGALWLFLGVELIPDEHHMKYEFFAKQHPTFRLTFQNPVTCLVCDTKSYEELTPQQREEFVAFCRHRFGLDDPRDCHAIFAEQQRRADETNRPPASPQSL